MTSLHKPFTEFRLPPYLVLVIGVFCVSTASILIRLVQNEASALTIAAYRMVLSVLILFPLAWQKREEWLSLPRSSLKFIGLGGIFLALHFAFWISSLRFTSVTSSVVLVTTTPLWVALVSPLVLKEHPSARTWAGLAIGITGGVIVSLAQGCTWQAWALSCPDFASFFQGKAFLGNIMALIGAWMASGYMVVGRKVRTGLSLISYVFMVYAVSAFVLLIFAILAQEKILGFSPLTYVYLLGLAVIPQLLGHSSYNYALGYLPAAFVALTILLEPIGASLLAMAILREFPNTLEILGGVIILLGVGLTSLPAKK